METYRGEARKMKFNIKSDDLKGIVSKVIGGLGGAEQGNNGL